MAGLKGSVRSFLRGRAHGLRPVVQIGKEGLSEAVLTAIDEALTSHELIKVQFLTAHESKREQAAEIETRLGAECVGLVGHIAIVFRQHPDPEKRKLTLPA